MPLIETDLVDGWRDSPNVGAQNQNARARKKFDGSHQAEAAIVFAGKSRTGRSCGVQSGRARSLALERATINGRPRSGRMLERDERKRKGKIREQEQLQLCLVVRSIEPVSSAANGQPRVALGPCSKGKSPRRRGSGRREGEISKKFTRNVQGMPRKEDSLTFGTPVWRAFPLDYDRSGPIPLSFRGCSISLGGGRASTPWLCVPRFDRDRFVSPWTTPRFSTRPTSSRRGSSGDTFESFSR